MVFRASHVVLVLERWKGQKIEQFKSCSVLWIRKCFADWILAVKAELVSSLTGGGQFFSSQLHIREFALWVLEKFIHTIGQVIFLSCSTNLFPPLGKKKKRHKVVFSPAGWTTCAAVCCKVVQQKEGRLECVLIGVYWAAASSRPAGHV